MVYGGSCDENCSSIHEPAGKMEARKRQRMWNDCTLLFISFTFFICLWRNWITYSWHGSCLGQRMVLQKKLLPHPSRAAFFRGTAFFFFFSECFIKIDERKRSVLRWDALCSERDLSKRSHAGTPCACPTGLLCAACWSFFLLSYKQLSNC